MPMQHFTPNDLLRMLYGEVTQQEEQRLKDYIANDAEVAVAFHQLSESKKWLNTARVEPSETSIQLILDYSMRLAHEEAHA
jgi:hypothetical protein